MPRLRSPGLPKSVLAYLSRYTHRVAISNHRLIKADADGVTFNYKDYRARGQARFKTMTLSPHEFIRRFLMHVLPKGFHRIRHYGLLANGNRAAMIARARELLAMASREKKPGEVQTAKSATAPEPTSCCCPRCGSRMIVIEVFARSCAPDYRPPFIPTEARHVMNRRYRQRAAIVSSNDGPIEPKQQNASQRTFPGVRRGHRNGTQQPRRPFQPGQMHRKGRGSDTRGERIRTSANFGIAQSP
jgi:hypothetical protein